MEKSIYSLNPEETLPLTFLEGITSRPTPVPTLFAIRFFCGELESALETLLQSQELQDLLSDREGEKDEIHECLQRAMFRFQEFLMKDARR
ncbi:MAG: hypothetical protein ACXAAO_10250 [Candidatus Thorarchaeota archaeon]